MGRFDIKTRAGLLSSIIQGQSASPSDGDAQAFIFRVEAAGGTLTTTEKNSINTLVVRLKAANIWTKLLAVYPMVGASAAACAQNLRSNNFTGAFSSGWAFASTGATPNGSSAYMDTSFNPRTSTTGFSQHLAMYSRTQNSTLSGVQIGCYDGVSAELTLYQYYASISRKGGSFYLYPNTSPLSTNTDTTGFQIVTRTSNTLSSLYFKGSLVNTNITTETLTRPNRTIFLGASNWGAASAFTSHEHAFSSMGDGLTDTEASDYYNIVQEFQTLLGRQIGAPSVSDPDATTFIQRVYTAGGTLTTAEQNAVNQLAIDLKAASIWTSMKAVYPMVGSSAAACAQNLKTGSFTGTFSAGWTFVSAGALPNGTSAYMNTGLNTSASLDKTSAHLSFYTSTNSNVGSPYDIGNSTNAGLNVDNTQLQVRYNNNLAYIGVADNGGYATNVSSTDSRGFWCGTRIINNQFIFKNGSRITAGVAGSGNLANNNLYIGASNGGGTAAVFSNKECAFASIGDGLTDTQAVYLNNAVETFQTSLSRNVGVIIPTVSDADATAFIARVYGAGGTLSTLECNAVNQLAISMKATGVWNSTKAVYPMVGASAAACAQNLKSTSYTGTFSGGWAYSSTGITGNGSNTYMNTTLVPSTELSQNSAHIAGYLRTTNSSNNALIGTQALYLLNYGYAAIHNADIGAVNTQGQTGFFLNSRIMSTQIKQYKNSTTLGTYTVTSTTPTSSPVYVGAINATPVQHYVNGQIAFASIGDGLTDQQESDYYSAVQAFQTTLSRNV